VLLYNTSDIHKAVAEAIQEMWKVNLGIRIQLSNQEWAVFQETRHQGNFTIARGGWIGDYSDPMTFLDMWLSYSGHNDAQWRNKEYDDIIERSKMIIGQERFELLYQAEKMLIDRQMVVMPIYYYTDAIMVKDYVRGWEKDSLNHWFFGKARLGR
jgi:oligopeptide transport system substrate-binding protein